MTPGVERRADAPSGAAPFVGSGAAGSSSSLPPRGGLEPLTPAEPYIPGGSAGQTEVSPEVVGSGLTSQTSGPAVSAGEAGPAGPALVITVHGKPAPQGSKRHVGRGVLVEQSTRVKPWREAVKAAALEARAPRIEDRPVTLEIVCCFDKPKSAPKRRRTWPITRSSGDVDKLQRAIFDALCDAGIFKDDSQVISVTAEKVYIDALDAPLDVPGAVIRVWDITELPEVPRGDV